MTLNVLELMQLSLNNMIHILCILSTILFCLHSFHLIEFKIHFLAEDTFEVALKRTGHPTDLSIDCTFKRSVKAIRNVWFLFSGLQSLS